MSFNLCIFQGNLTKDPELKKVADKTVAKFTVAVNSGYKDKKEVLFMDCETWGTQGDNVGKYLTKGKPVIVEGRLKVDQFEGVGGIKRSKNTLVTSNVVFLSTSGKVEELSSALMPKASKEFLEDIDAFTGQGELPF